MKRIALVLVAVLLVLMVGACGGEEAKPTETEAVTTTSGTEPVETKHEIRYGLDNDLQKLLMDMMVVYTVGIETTFYKLLDSVNFDPSKLIAKHSDDSRQFIVIYTDIIQVEGLYAGYGGAFNNEENLALFRFDFLLKDNPTYQSLDELHNRVNAVCEAALYEWDTNKGGAYIDYQIGGNYLVDIVDDLEEGVRVQVIAVPKD